MAMEEEETNPVTSNGVAIGIVDSEAKVLMNGCVACTNPDGELSVSGHMWLQSDLV